MLEAGRHTIAVGGKQPGFSGNADASITEIVSGSLEMTESIILSPPAIKPED